MNWKNAEERLRQGAQLVYTNDIPGGWCFAVRLKDSPGHTKLVRIQRPRSHANTVNAVLYAYRVFSMLRRTEDGKITWKEVKEHVRQGAQLVYTNDIPGGCCLALRHWPNGSTGRAKMIRIGSFPRGIGLPNPADHGPILTGLETSIATEMD